MTGPLPPIAAATVAPEGARSPLDDCVHCGFCLPACPTYVSWREEMDSPRGRIDLMRGLAEGQIAFNATVVAHFDRCLGCMACLPACPSGVRYDVLIEETRARIEREHRRRPLDRLLRAALFAVLPYPRRLAAVALLLQGFPAASVRRLFRSRKIRRLLPRVLAELEALAPAGPRGGEVDLPRLTPSSGAARARVALLAGCVQRVFFPEVNAATIRVLAAEGCEVVVPVDQGCCGSLSIHAGREEEARGFARRLIEAFEAEERSAPLDAIVVNAAGCGSHLKDLQRLFADDPAWRDRATALAARVRDVTELLVALGATAPRHPLPVRVAYHDACHLAHAQRIRAAPRELLRSIPQLELVEVPEGDQCCGSAGIYNLVQPASAGEIGERKAENVLATGAELLASANPGCTLQIQKHLRARGRPMAAVHPVEILDASLRGIPVPARNGLGGKRCLSFG